MSAQCFLCQKDVDSNQVCPFCKEAFVCCDDHLNIHRGTVKTPKGRKGEGCL